VSTILLPYVMLFIWSFLAATLLPLSSEVALGTLVLTHQQLALPVLVATAGNYAGACTTYCIARRTTGELARQGVMQTRSTRAERLWRRYGPPTLLLSWVPLVGDGLVILAGAAHVPFRKFSLWVVIGKFVRYVSVAMAVLTIG
jgi:membrane protein YqaA with SNARE-associated domain